MGPYTREGSCLLNGLLRSAPANAGPRRLCGPNWSRGGPGVGFGCGLVTAAQPQPPGALLPDRCAWGGSHRLACFSLSPSFAANDCEFQGHFHEQPHLSRDPLPAETPASVLGGILRSSCLSVEPTLGPKRSVPFPPPRLKAASCVPWQAAQPVHPPATAARHGAGPLFLPRKGFRQPAGQQAPQSVT